MNKIKSKKCTALLLLFTTGAALLSGCEGSKRPAAIIQPQLSSEEEKTQAQNETERMAQCQKELEALKDINLERHTALRQEFDRLMNAAASYANVRTRVNSETKDTVDALYRYKINRLCADITQATLNGLADRGERLK